jgi:L-amino acid N-acyltransferase
MIEVRDATVDDMNTVSALHNVLIPTTTNGWTEHQEHVEQRQEWFQNQMRVGYPVLVAVDSGSLAVVGFATFGDFRDSVKWPGYRFVVEHTIQIDETHWGRGVGRLLINELFARASALGKTQMIGAIDSANHASIEFHRRLGFVEVARMPSIGYKFDSWLDLVLVQRSTDRKMGNLTK